MAIRLVLADDHPIVLDGLETLFRLEPDFQIAARCVSGEEAVVAVRRHQPDVLILDIHMPRKDGLAVLRDLRREKLPTKVVLLAAVLEEEEVLEALRLDVRGMVLKELAPQMVVQCVRKVHAGERWLEKHAVTRVVDSLLRREAGEREAANVLTPREIEMVGMVARGLRNKEMSERLAISEGTVKIHLHHIYRKLKVENRVELILYAQSKRLV
ncbi:MAG TPA: response regulator transcription factor [Gemmatimonadales bacterium]|nr:response regulator transcription factor [Gemmatimonadales bacterium]